MHINNRVETYYLRPFTHYFLRQASVCLVFQYLQTKYSYSQNLISVIFGSPLKSQGVSGKVSGGCRRCSKMFGYNIGGVLVIFKSARKIIVSLSWLRAGQFIVMFNLHCCANYRGRVRIFFSHIINE